MLYYLSDLMLPSRTLHSSPSRYVNLRGIDQLTIPLPSLANRIDPSQMLSRAAARTTTSLVTKRGFQTTRARMSSPYHYPEGAYSNIPFNPRSKWFGLGYWTFMATGFFAPFGIAVYQTYKPQ
ncbi:elongator complex 1 [Fusarium phyllophilum]|uniref:Cytochrome c oxidase subunit 8, mitochondrial n=1 Tax=Fusarium phyllophilum TaxID=47803 RepID=A0A8H5IQB5_9HYPO|nr:elongator complex 1 [Fusarium phyllophilum]